MDPAQNGAYAAYRPWSRMKRKVALPDSGPEDGGGWLYLTSSATGRDHATSRVEAMDWPQGCDQCARLIPHNAPAGARSFRVSRGLKPTTLYLCGTCVESLCAAGNVPVPEPGT